MAHNPVCEKCLIAKALADLALEYQWFIEFIKKTNLNPLTPHARGYCHGQTAFAHDAIDDIESLIPWVVREAKLRAKSSKGL